MVDEIAPREVLMHAFPGIGEQEAGEIISFGKMLALPQETVICHEGELESTFYILLDGCVKVTKTISRSEERILTNLVRGNFFGEMAIVGDAPRAATVIASTPVLLLEIHKEAFTGMLQNNNQVLLAIVRAVSRRLRENDEMSTGELRLKAKELAGAYQQLAEQDYARSQFLSTVALELRTPLTASSGFLQVIQMGLLQGEALEEALDTIARNLQDIVALTNDILFMQEREMILPQFQPVDIGRVITNAIELERNQAEHNQIGFRMEIAAELPMVNGHVRSLQRAIQAVLNNAIKFSPDGGEVIINAQKEQDMVKITIQDHGVGIPPEALPRIFQRFFHIDKMGTHLFGGIGIGLPIARQVIEQHHGKISVESELGKGSLFTIRLHAA